LLERSCLVEYWFGVRSPYWVDDRMKSRGNSDLPERLIRRIGLGSQVDIPLRRPASLRVRWPPLMRVECESNTSGLVETCYLRRSALAKAVLSVHTRTIHTWISEA
jgi:hypothetical protein